MEQREGYKKTAIGWIPEDWDCVSLGDIAQIKGRIGWKGLKKNEYTETGPYLIAGKHIKSSNINWDLCDHISDERYDESMEIALQEGDTILTKDGSIGNPAFIENLPGKATINSTMLLVRANESFHPKFIFFQFQSNGFNRLVREKLSGSSIPHIFQRDMISFSIPFPPLPEQQKIADILTTVDEKISSIDSRIQQTEQLKKGLMEKLLTEGIGHTEFKETEIGRIPIGWSVENINTISDRKSGHTPNRKVSEYWNGGIKWVSLADTFRLDKRYIKATEYNISEAGILNSSAVKLQKGAVIISRDAGIGKSAIIGHSMAVSQHFIAWECGNALFNLFLFYLLQKWKPKFERIANGTTIKTIGLDFFKKMEIPLPPLPEQKQIATILSTVDDKLDILTQKKSRYQTLKKGLSQQLLTGQMRVKV